MGAAWFFLVWALGAHNGHSFTTRVVIDRIVMPTKEVCEAARHGVEEYLVGDEGALYKPGPCEPVPREREQRRKNISSIMRRDRP